MKLMVMLILLLFTGSSQHGHAAKSVSSLKLIGELKETMALLRDLEGPGAKYDVVLKRDPMLPLVNQNGKVILKTGFQEIGVAVKKGIYEGSEVWMAVQEFGRPKGDCTEANSALLSSINTNRAQLLSIEVLIKNKKQELNSFHPKNGAIYNNLIIEHNRLVNEYNELVESTKVLVANYNEQVEKYNNCL